MTNRYARLVGVLALTLGAAAGRADDPKPDPKAPHQRMLTGDDAKKASALERQVAKLEAADQRAEAAKVAEELLTLRSKLQGADHWQVRTARLMADDLRRPLTAEQKEQLAESQRLSDRAERLSLAGKTGDAIPAAEKALALTRQVRGDHPATADGLSALAILHAADERFADAERLFGDALKICRKTLGDEHPFTIDRLYNLALLYREQGKLGSAEPLFKDVLRTSRRVYGEGHSSTFASLNDLARVYEERGKFADAEALLKDALRASRDAFGDEHSRTLRSLNDLAVLTLTMGKLADAEALATAALRTSRKLHGDGHASTVVCMSNLASVYRSQKKLADAERLATDVLRIRRRTLGDEDPDTATAFNNLAGVYQAQEKFADAERLFKDAIRVHRKVHGDEHLNTAVSVSNLARLYRDQGKLADAEPLLRDALRIHRKELGAEHSLTAIDLNNLASVLLARGRFTDAEPLYEEALRVHRKLHGDEHPSTAHSRHELASLYHAQGRFADAEPLFKDAVRVFRSVHGDEHPSAAASLNGLAGVFKAQSQFTDAERLHKEALRIRRKALGEEHPDTAASLDDLASLYFEQGKLADAESLYTDALRIRRKVLGDDRSDTALSMNGLAYVYTAQGKYADAERLFKDALRCTRNALGEDHPRAATSLNGLAALHRARGQFADAETLYADAVRLHRKAYGDEHPHTANSLNALAVLRRDQGKFAEAEALYADAIRVYRKAFGDEHPHTAHGLNNLAHVYHDQGKLADAERLYEDAERIIRKALGDEHFNTAACLSNLGSLYHDQRKFADAERLQKEALRIRRKALGEEHPDTAVSLNNLASVYRARGRLADAEPLHDEALRISRKLYGDDHPFTFICLNNLAWLHEVQGKFADAERLYKEALRVCQKVYGDEHPDTAHTLHNLAGLYFDHGKFADAEPLLVRATAAYEAARLTAARGVDRAVFGGYITPYPSLAVTEIALGKARSAFGSLESNLARVLLDESFPSGVALTPDEVALRDRLTARLGEVRPRVLALATLREPTDAERKELAALTAERGRLTGQLAPLAATANRRGVADLAAVQRALPKDAAWVAWVDLSGVGRLDEHWACVVRPTGDPHWERLPGSGEKQKWTRADDGLPDRLRSAIVGSRNAAPAVDVAELAKQLRAQRIAPVAKHLDGVKTLYVVATHLMAEVPVELLAPEYTVSYSPSGTFLAQLGDRPKLTTSGALALGDPIFTRPGDKPAEKRLPPGGLLVTALAADGSAARANLRPGDVLLKYGDTELTDAASLQKAIDAHTERKTVPVVVWRESADKPFVRDVAPGRLGVVIAPDPAPVALANRRRIDAAVAARVGWDELPGTRVEANGLRKLFGDRATVLTDSDASEQKLDALRKAGDLKKYRYLHLATHGKGNPVRILESYLVLAQDTLSGDLVAKPGEPLLDGRLTAREVLDLWQLDSELVTLSACETAIGRSGGGDGVLGFAHALLTVGSRAVCLSLWKVDDTATALLMNRFYQNLLGKRVGLKGPMGKAAALAEAKAWLRELSSDQVLEYTAEVTKGVVRGPGQKALTLDPPKAPPRTEGGQAVRPPAVLGRFCTRRRPQLIAARVREVRQGLLAVANR